MTLRENADRFCGSAANTSTGYCTLVNPLVAKVSTCTAANIAKEPYYSDCRWKTQNVKVHHNTFKINRANVSKCPASMCGRNAIFSNFGTFPSWSPYKGEKVSKAITHDQGNVFSDNTYVGGWNFTAFDTGRLVSPFWVAGGTVQPGQGQQLHQLSGSDDKRLRGKRKSSVVLPSRSSVTSRAPGADDSTRLYDCRVP